MLKRSVLGLIAAISIGFAATTVSAMMVVSSNCLADFVNIGPAANYAVFALNTTEGRQTVIFSNAVVNGNVGIASKGYLYLAASSTINGSLDISSANAYRGSAMMSGAVSPMDLSGACNSAISASEYAAGIQPPDQTYANISKNLTVQGFPGLNVIDVNGSIDLNNASLTLDGSSSSVFIINLAGSLTLSGKGGILTKGGVLSSNVLINMTGSGKLLSTHAGNTIEGIVLGPDIGGTIRGTNGPLILGRSFTLISHATVN